ncbi:glycosyltransferase family 2 protein [Candidatus Beckwithbacteria bacterium]|nr:glycosyltransferase family 2 protein [Candidatus Beckwithbacteria bacterium]
MIDISIIILNYNTKDITLKCLESVCQSDFDSYSWEIVLVDNASSDDSAKAFKTFKQDHKQIKVTIIENTRNTGFAAGNNKGIRKASGTYILLLNSDVILEKDTIKKQLNFLEKNQDFAAATCKLILQSGKLDPACHRGFPTPWASLTYFAKLEKLFPTTKLFGGYHQGWKDMTKAHQVDVISGAFFLIRKQVLDQVGLFDEGYFMYAEDIDLCLRLKKQGFNIAFNPVSQALHLKGESGRKDKQSKSHYYFWETMQLFYKKHYAKTYPKPLMWLIFAVINWQKGKYEDRA